jgi:hypothetical protein
MKASSTAPGCRVSFTAVLWASCLALFSSGLGAAPLSEEVPVPGGAAALSRALGLDPAPERARFMAQLTRAIYDTPDGTSSATDALLRTLTNYLRSSGPATAREIVQIGTVPVPLSAKVWSDAVFGRRVDVAALFPAIITDRRAALLSYGLAALDDETLQFLSAHQALLRRWYQHDASVFAAFAGSLRIHNNAIVLPGGDAARSLWEGALDESAARPERFISALFGRDKGRVAYLYDALGQFDRPTSHFALGLWINDTRRRMERFKSLLAAIDAFPGWVVPERPFRRPPDDPILMLMRVAVAPDGAPTGPSWHAFWSHAFESPDIPDNPADLLKSIQADGRIDAAWLAEAILGTELQSRGERLDQLAFGMRAFAGADDRMLPDALVAVRAFPRYRMLMLTLEHMGIANPVLYTAAARHAVRLSALDASRGFVALSQFQSALAILARLVTAHVLDAAHAETLVASLCAVPLNGDGSYAGGIARWFQRSLAPVAGIRIDDFDADLIRSLAGVRQGNLSAQTLGSKLVFWEQTAYALDLTTAEGRRLTRVLEKLQADSIGQAMALETAAERLSARTVTVADVKGATESLTAMQAALATRRNRRDVVGRSIEDLSKINAAKDLKKASEVADSLYELVDDVLADALISVTYALSLGDPQGTTLLSGNVSRRHDFGFSEKNGEMRLRAPWMEPEQRLQPGVPWHVRGSLLGLDLGLSSLALRRTSLGALPEAPTLRSTDKDIFTQTIALLNVFELRDGDRDVIVEGIARGGERIAALAGHIDALDAIADEIMMDGWRRRAVRWSLVNDPQHVPTFFSLAELLHLGKPPTSATLDAWGMAASAYDGCICTVLAPPGRWILGAGRWPRGTVATHVADLNLRVAVALAELKLPAALARGVLAAAMQDYVDRVKPSYPDDWLTLVRSAQAFSTERIQDYIATLTINGPLVPDSSDNDSLRER